MQDYSVMLDGKSADLPYVNLYGYNVDIEQLSKEIAQFVDTLNNTLNKQGKTAALACFEGFLSRISPAVIATACAGISHQKKSFEQLRNYYRNNIEELVKLDRKLVRMGHKSIVEHMYFNVDIIGTRLLMEIIEKHRLASYTEKSQRFVDVNSAELPIPPELQDCADVAGLRDQQISFYNHAIRAGIPKEDARFILPLFTLTKLEFSVNGRELEYIIQKLASHELNEAKALAEKLKQVVYKVPYVEHLIKYTNADEYYKQNKLEELCKSLTESVAVNNHAKAENSRTCTVEYVKLDDDAPIFAAFLFHHTRRDYNICLELAKNLTEAQKRELIKAILEYMQSYHDLPREFENASISFSAVMSASCFAQLKRHRMMTLLPQQYMPEFGFVIPESIANNEELAKRYIQIIESSSALYRKIERERGYWNAAYVLTNAHKRRVYCMMNFREFYHFLNLRYDKHAQWEIRQLASYLREKFIASYPWFSFFTGKDKFEEEKAKYFG